VDPPTNSTRSPVVSPWNRAGLVAHFCAVASCLGGRRRLSHAAAGDRQLSLCPPPHPTRRGAAHRDRRRQHQRPRRTSAVRVRRPSQRADLALAATEATTTGLHCAARRLTGRTRKCSYQAHSEIRRPPRHPGTLQRLRRAAAGARRACCLTPATLMRCCRERR
jgi:hypothetical protein